MNFLPSPRATELYRIWSKLQPRHWKNGAKVLPDQQVLIKCRGFKLSGGWGRVSILTDTATLIFRTVHVLLLHFCVKQRLFSFYQTKLQPFSTSVQKTAAYKYPLTISLLLIMHSYQQSECNHNELTQYPQKQCSDWGLWEGFSAIFCVGMLSLLQHYGNFPVSWPWFTLNRAQTQVIYCYSTFKPGLTTKKQDLCDASAVTKHCS